MKNFIREYWILIVFGLVCTGLGINHAYEVRGYFAFGGEYLILPLFFVAYELVRGCCNALLWLAKELELI